MPTGLPAPAASGDAGSASPRGAGSAGSGARRPRPAPPLGWSSWPVATRGRPRRTRHQCGRREGPGGLGRRRAASPGGSALGLANLANIFDPECIVLGGGLVGVRRAVPGAGARGLRRSGRRRPQPPAHPHRPRPPRRPGRRRRRRPPGAEARAGEVGLIAPVFARDPNPAIEVARQADEGGLDGVFSYDHLFPINSPERPALSALPMLAAMATQTERIAIGTLVSRVTLLPLPVLLDALATLDEIAGGRAIAGLGTGDSPDRAREPGVRVGVSLARRAAGACSPRRRGASGNEASAPGSGGAPARCGPSRPHEADGWNSWDGPLDELAAFADATKATAEATWGGPPPPDGAPRRPSPQPRRVGRQLGRLRAAARASTGPPSWPNWLVPQRPSGSLEPLWSSAGSTACRPTSSPSSTSCGTRPAMPATTSSTWGSATPTSRAPTSRSRSCARRPTIPATTATRRHGAFPSCAWRWPTCTCAASASSSTPTPRWSPPSAPRRGCRHLMWTLVGPGDTALVPTPSYPIHIYAPLFAGADVQQVRLGPDQDFFANLMDSWESTWPRPRVIVFSFPHNPTTEMRRPGLDAAPGRLRPRARRGPGARLRLLRHRVRRLPAAVDPAGARRQGCRGRAVHVDQELLDGRVAGGVPGRQRRDRGRP